MKRILLASLTFAGLALPALAQGPGWTEVSTVVEMINTANGGFNIRLSPELTGCSAQSGYTGVYASVYPSHPGLKQMKADATVSFMTGARIALYLSDSMCTVAEMRLMQ